ncbi:hypothetical protein [Aquamicrobium sp. LC103]|uniref:hypothetical protein n=1 Tax=Aquamicrobium sp. LC103 TaxID=1120658 RepID=UPI00063EA66C|nr:hypothetical protein [Aquamicrobium sp. LC103]TKT80370.1 hypothetical protein XW59_008520 [Aquamicrobium sp. LC103]
MFQHPDDCAKRRLTERTELRIAAEFLMIRGFKDEEIAVQLSRYYYIDVDELNDVLAAMPAEKSRPGARQTPQWRQVA